MKRENENIVEKKVFEMVEEVKEKFVSWIENVKNATGRSKRKESRVNTEEEIPNNSFVDFLEEYKVSSGKRDKEYVEEELEEEMGIAKQETYENIGVEDWEIAKMRKVLK